MKNTSDGNDKKNFEKRFGFRNIFFLFEKFEKKF